MIEFNWNITDIDVVDISSQSNVIKSFNWSITAQDEGQSATYSSLYYSSEGVESVEVINFLEFNDLTKDMCVSWVVSAIGIELDDIKEKLRLELKAKITAAQRNIVDAPW